MNVKNIKINFRILRENKGRLFRIMLKSGRLFFLVAFGFALVYFFNVIYKRVYIEISFIEYPSNVNYVNVHRESSALGKITENIEARQRNLEDARVGQLRDPFSFANNSVQSGDGSYASNDSQSMTENGYNAANTSAAAGRKQIAAYPGSR